MQVRSPIRSPFSSLDMDVFGAPHFFVFCVLLLYLYLQNFSFAFGGPGVTLAPLIFPGDSSLFSRRGRVVVPIFGLVNSCTGDRLGPYSAQPADVVPFSAAAHNLLPLSPLAYVLTCAAPPPPYPPIRHSSSHSSSLGQCLSTTSAQWA
jgi:hypothetical protein